MGSDGFVVLEAAGIAAVQLEPTRCKIKRSNVSFHRMLGLDEGADLKDRSFTELLDEVAADGWSQALNGLTCRSLESWSGEITLVHRDGRTLPVRCTAASVSDRDGEIDRIDVIVQPISQSTNSIRTEFDIFPHLFDDAPATVAVFEGPHHIVRYANPEALKVSLTPTPVGLPLLEATPRAFGKGILEPLSSVLRTSTPVVLNEFLVTFDSDRVPAETYWDAILLPWRAQGEVIGVIVFGFDVSEQVKASRERESSKRTLELALESARVGVWSLDVKEQVFTFDERCVALFGVEPTMPLAELMDRVHPEDRKRIEQTGEHIASPDGNSDCNVEMRLYFPDHSIRWLAALGRSQFDPENSRCTVRGVAVDITERKLAEEALRESEERLRLTVENSPVVLFEQGRDLRYTWIQNPSMGLATDDLIGKTDAEILGAETTKELTQFKRQAVESGERLRGEFELVKDGQTMWWDVALEPRFDANGEVARIAGIAVNITARHETELALRISETRLRHTIESARLSLFEWDVEQDRFRAYGYLKSGAAVHNEDGTWGDYGGIDDAIACRGDSRDSYMRAIHRALYETGELEWEGRIVQPQGSEHAGAVSYIHDRGRVQYDENGKPKKLFGVVIDTTQRYLIEQEVERQRERLQRMLESSPVGIAFVRRGGKVRECNDAFLSALELERKDFVEQGLNLFVYCEHARDQWQRLLEEGSGKPPMPLSIPHTRSKPAVVLASAVQLESDSDEVAVFLTDITERIEMEAELRKLNEALEREVHERSQAHALVRELALQQTAVEHQERRRIAQTLHDHFQQLLVAAKFSLVNAMRSAPEAGNQDFAHTEELINEAIAASRNLAVELFPPVLYEAGLGEALAWLADRYHSFHRLDVHVETDGVEEGFDEEVKVYLYQAAHELLLNVVKHARTPEAWLTLADHGKTINLVVEDHGAGCDPNILSEALPRTSGFGLFQIQQRINLLGGEVTLKLHPGGGCRVEIEVPKALPTRPKVLPTIEHEPTGDTSNPRR